MKARVIALYLPQFHPTESNDKWWGKGFTEWTNVGRAKKLFFGHEQPKVPADLGYYDLRLPESREAQASLAREAGIDGFCYYHYWFDTGRQELELPFERVLESGKPDFPFMLCWANESWHAKFWKFDGTVEKKLLVEQKYGTEKEWTDHFNHLLRAFKDSRYMRYDNKPMFMVYRPLEAPMMIEMMQCWNKLAQDNGLEGIHFIAQTSDYRSDVSAILDQGFAAINNLRLWSPIIERSLIKRVVYRIVRTILSRPYICNYVDIYKGLTDENDRLYNVYPSLIPNWDHTPRSGRGGYVWVNSTPHYFQQHAKQVISQIQHKDEKDRIIFLKSWNEWGEGNYMEPDLKYGKGYIEALRKELD